jgi:hypothetical protein
VADHDVGVALFEHPERQTAAHEVGANLDVLFLSEGENQNIEKAGVADARGRGQNEVTWRRVWAGTACQGEYERNRSSDQARLTKTPANHISE